MTLKSDVKFEEKPIFCLIKDNNLVNFDPSTQKSEKFCTLVGLYYRNCITFDLKKYRGIIFHDTEE